MKIRWREITDPTGKNPVQWIEWKKADKSDGQCVACPEWIKSYLGERSAKIILLDLLAGRRSGVIDDGQITGPVYRVVVGNVGTVSEVEDRDIAENIYDQYVQSSKDGIGRVAGESVTIFRDDEIVREYVGTVDAEA